MKKSYYLYGAALAMLAVGLTGYGIGKETAKKTSDSSISYVNDKSTKKALSKAKGDKTPDQISAEEGISAEQIVIKITDKGYVTSHGDHYHFYNGKVPYDALISEELVMKDPNYVFSQEHVINEVKDGYIIKVNGQYYLYLKEGASRKNIRTKEQIAEQAEKGRREATENAKAGATTGSKAANSKKASLEAKKQQAAISKAKAQGRYTTDDGYIFSPTDVIDDLGDAFLVPHGDHFHFIPKSDLSASELAAAQHYWNNRSSSPNKTTVAGAGTGSHAVAQPSNATPATQPPLILTNPGNSAGQPTIIVNPTVGGGHHTISGNPNRPGTLASNGTTINVPNVAQTTKTFDELLAILHALPLSNRHQEGDGLVFEPNHVIRKTNRGYVVPHGNHYHVIPASTLSTLEIQLAEMHLNGQKTVPTSTQEQPNKDSDNKDQTKPVVTPEKDKDAAAPESSSDTTEAPAPSTDKDKDKEDTTSSQPAPIESTENPTTGATDDHTSEEDEHDVVKNINLFDGSIIKTPMGQDGIPYETDDGYIFSKESIVSYDDFGIIAEHDGHEHYVPYADLDDDELQEVASVINNHSGKVSRIQNSSFSNKEIADKLLYLSLENDVALESLKVTGNKVIIPHGNHTHTANLEAIKTALSRKDYDSQEEYDASLISFLMTQARRDYKTTDIRRVDGYLLINGEQKVDLSTIKLPFAFDSIDFSRLKTAVDPYEDKLNYIAKQYNIKRGDIYRLYDNIVYVSQQGLPTSVDLRLIDITAPLIYTLDKNADIEALKKKAGIKDSVPPTDSTTLPKPVIPSTDQEDAPEVIDAKLDYIAKQYKVNRIELVRDGDIVFINDWNAPPPVSLRLVDINEPIIYTLKKEDDKNSETNPKEGEAEPKEDATAPKEEDPKTPSENEETPKEPSEDKDSEVAPVIPNPADEDEDPYDTKIAAIVAATGLSTDEVEERVTALTLEYAVSVEALEIVGNKLSFYANGVKITYDIINQEAI